MHALLRVVEPRAGYRRVGEPPGQIAARESEAERTRSNVCRTQELIEDIVTTMVRALPHHPVA